jgi:hypothetical protein
VLLNLSRRYFVAQAHVAAQVQSNKIQPFSLDASTFYSKYNIATSPYPKNLDAAALVGGHLSHRVMSQAACKHILANHQHLGQHQCSPRPDAAATHSSGSI